MKKFALLDENNVVLNISVGADDWSAENWICCPDSTGIGYIYNHQADVFIAPQPYPSWSLDENFDWQAPSSRPEGMGWYWDEDSLSWIQSNA